MKNKIKNIYFIFWKFQTGVLRTADKLFCVDFKQIQLFLFKFISNICNHSFVLTEVLNESFTNSIDFGQILFKFNSNRFSQSFILAEVLNEYGHLDYDTNFNVFVCDEKKKKILNRK